MKWVSVDDRLPIKMDRYDIWVSGDENERPRRITDAIFSQDHGGWLSKYGGKIDNATHWMPLPEPPEVES